MTATTPKRALTYVTPADKPQVYPAASKALADTLDAFLGLTASTAVTFGPKFTGGTVVCYRVSGLIVATVNCVTTAATAAGDIIFTMPAGYVPVGLFYGNLVNTSTEANVRCHPDTDRTVKVQAALASGITVRGTLVMVTA